MAEMINSGIDWIGEIATSHPLIRLKYIADILDEYRKPVEANKRNQDAEELYPYYGASGAIDTIDGYTIDDHVMLIGEDGANLRMRNLPLMYEVAGKAWINNHAHILKPKKTTDFWYLFYALECLDINPYITGSAQPKLNQENLKNILIPFPDYKTQKIITDIVVPMCTEINALYTDIQSEIDVLEEYKRSVVFFAIEHGMGHKDFAQTDSMVWTSIPKGWKLVDIKYLFEIVKRIAGKEGYDVLAITQQGLKFKDISSNEGQLAADYSGYQFVYPGDYAMNHMDLLTGWVDLSDKFGVTSPDYRVFKLRDTKNYDRKFYKYVMQCCYMCHIFYSLGQGVSNLGRWRLQTSAFNNFKVPVPPYDEQVRLGNYLDEKINQINSIIEQKQEQLEILADYKKSMIYEYVTGKKEVV